MKALVEARADSHARDPRQMTPIMFAASTAALPQLSVLLRNADETELNMQNEDGRTVLDLVSRTGAPVHIRKLLQLKMNCAGDSSKRSSAQHRSGASVKRQEYQSRSRLSAT